ncbi:Transcription-repair-coupling factor [Candidatus Bealeia paramacronuclearis]|uniref:Transcription-repair-coupling factor n=1 Tax=Candidatus Bealeia paramacronuclearis TaxID=1921001 RepID=A0ABZ2C683_9PROT|nr:Transcription-repair-coupling factor [Candidatus Bealeia paramacronuclearis]
MISLNLKNSPFFLSQVPESSEAWILSQLTHVHHNWVHVVSAETHSEELKLQLQFVDPHLEVLTFPGWDCLPYDRVSPHADVIARRIDTLSKLIKVPNPRHRRLILTSIPAISQRVMPKSTLSKTQLILKKGEKISFDHLMTFLSSNGYVRREMVCEWGEFALRGGIVDIFPPGQDLPLRLDFFGEELESLKVFDPLTQISSGKVESLEIKPMGEILLNPESIEQFRKSYRNLFPDGSREDPLYHTITEGSIPSGAEHWLPLFYPQLDHFFDYLDNFAVSFDHNYEESLKDRLEHVRDHYKTRIDFQQLEKKHQGLPYYPVPSDLLYVSKKEFEERLEAIPYGVLSPLTWPESKGQVFDTEGKIGLTFASSRLQQHHHIFEDLKPALDSFLSHNGTVLILGMTAGSTDRLTHMLEEFKFAPVHRIDHFQSLKKGQINLGTLEMGRGFQSPELLVITEEDLFGERLGHGRARARKKDLFLTEASSLEPGDYVVHVAHGIGRYEGLETLQVSGTRNDCLVIIYDGESKLYVPVENIEALSRYGSKDSFVQLDRLGGVAWQARKAKVKDRIKKIAEHLMRVAAERALHRGEVMTKPEGLYEEFAARFPYPETDDQLRAIEEALEDMSSGKVMDRLVCGDVGFGKTEVAMRAAFVAAASGKQVAVVVPTTLLARQHYQSFVKRFEGSGLKIAQLSRLVKPSESQKIKDLIRSGEVDIVIGTHGIFSKSMSFPNLGLLIVDEEQHFGVSQKERLKELQSDVHVLTLTATPIPRTLQMALAGVREMSLIATPPVDRLSVRTFVMPFDGMVIREAILREKFRGGLSFYVCPRLQDLAKVKERLQTFVPEATFGVAHGQLPASELEDVMTQFYDGHYDVLLSTNIIESGIDISRANTLIVHHADRFGLAQLYQLRGRVGRAKVRGYAYFTLPATHPVTPTALKRLEVIQSLESLGAGFTVASHDLDIRGAGNILGDEQSGHIKEVGVELYQHMLEEAILALKSQNRGMEDIFEAGWTPQIQLGLSVLIPETYVSDLGLRMSLYRRLGTFQAFEDIDQFRIELVDRFGTIPGETENLLEIIRLKLMCKKANIEKIEAGPKGFVLTLYQNKFENPAGLLNYIQKQAGTAKIRPDQKIVFTRVWPSPQGRLKGVQGIVQEIGGLV